MSDFTFEGFEPANTTPVPDVLFDQLLSELSEAELKVLLYIIRRTAGFKKQTDAISLTQFQKGIRKRATGEILDKGCGVKDRATIVKALASLEKMGCIESTKSNDPQGDKATSAYRVRFRSVVVGKTNHPTDIGSGESQPPWFAKPTTGSGESQPGVVGKTNPQETVIQLDSKQETDSQKGTYSERESEPAGSGSLIASPTHAQFAFQVQGWDRHYYHDYCIHAQDQGINDGMTLIVRSLADVPRDAECSICYKPVHGPHGYDELPPLDEDVPYRPDFTASQERASLPQFFDDAIESAQRAGALPTTTTQGETHDPTRVDYSGSERDGDAGRRVALAPAHSRDQSSAGNAGRVAEAADKDVSETCAQVSGEVEPAPAKPKRSRTPRVPKIDPEEMDLYRRVFDDCRREALSDESEGYPHTKASDKCIEDLLSLNASRPKFVTPKKLHAVYVRLWNLPKDERSGFHWREHMSIKAVCHNYEEQALALTAAAKEKQRASRVVSEEEARQHARELAESGELIGGIYRRYVPPTDAPFHYITAEERAALFGGK